MADYVETSDDNGGVHINSGIPNRAFHLAATAIGGSSAEGAGTIWYAALTSGISADTDFAGFAQATVAAAGEHADAVITAWTTVGVAPGAASSTPAPGAGTRVAAGAGLPQRRLRRATRERRGRPDRLRRPRRRRARPGRADRLLRAPPGTPQPDRYVYEFRTPTGEQVVVQEQDLTEDLRRLAALVLDD